jgi:hypothetical protein
VKNYTDIRTFCCYFDVECRGGMEWTECGSACTPTCYETPMICTANCVPRCECPAGKVVHNGRCIVKEDCPAVEDIGPIPETDPEHVQQPGLY